MGGIKKIRFQQNRLILISETDVAGFELFDDMQIDQWILEFHLRGEYFTDALLVHETKFVTLSIENGVLAWTISNYELQQQFSHVIAVNEHRSWPLGDKKVLDISDVGLCLIADELGTYVLDLMKVKDDPARGWSVNVDNNGYGIGCFLRPCGANHQQPFFFSAYKYLEWTIDQKVQNGTQIDDYRVEDYWSHRSWAPGLQRDDPAVFSSCYSYSSGIALVWDDEEPALSAVILLEYTEGPGNGRFYNEFDVMDGYYLPSATSTKFEHVLRTLLDAKCGLNSAMIKFVVNNGSISLLEQALIQAQDGIFWDDLTRMAYIEKWARQHPQRHHNDGEQEHSVERICSTDNMTGNTRISPEGSHTYASSQTSAVQNVMGQRLKTRFGWESSHVSAPAYATITIFLFAAQLSDILLYGLKLAWTALSITVALEILSLALLNTGLISQTRPRKYYTPSKVALDTITGYLERLIVLLAFECQRLLFSEDVFISGAALWSAFLFYHLAGIIPLWALTIFLVYLGRGGNYWERAWARAAAGVGVSGLPTSLSVMGNIKGQSIDGA